MKPKLKAVLDNLAASARINLETSGHLLPVAFIFEKGYEKTGRIHIIGCPWHNDEEKEASVIAIREFARDTEAVAVTVLHEAWLAVCANGHWDGTPASKMANRKEVVMLYVEEQDGYWLGQADITRETGRPTFGEVKWQPMQERDSRERFQKLLPA